MDPKLLHDLMAIVKGFRNGLVYGAKVRFPHALVMTFLFQSGSIESKFAWILKATKQHAWNLGRFVLIYKTAMLLLKHFVSGGKEESWHSFISGCLGGFLIFRNENSVNVQITLYLLSRVIGGLLKTFYQKIHLDQNPLGSAYLLSEFPLKTTLCWGFSMWLFRYYPHNLQSSFRASMNYLYKDSEEWTCFKDFILVNKLDE